VDIEFIDIDNPKFVQVRPMTKKINLDKNLESLKMVLQELPYSHYIENDFCKIISENQDYEQSFIDNYLINIKTFYEKFFDKKIDILHDPFIKI
jgi:hypothetical protein